MSEFIVDILRTNPLGAAYLRTETYNDEEEALRSADKLTSDPSVIEVTVRMDNGRRSSTLSIWSRTTAGYCRAAKQTKLVPSKLCGGTTPPAGSNAGPKTL